MKPRNRSLSGALIAVFTLPVFMGLLACIPTFDVPIGDPEKSRIDPDITGWWFVPENDDTLLYVFEPYDKRTWLLHHFEVEVADDDACDFNDGFDDFDEDNPDFDAFYAARIAEFERLGSDCFYAEYRGVVKAWRTKLGGEWFMTWEPKMLLDSSTNFEPDEWVVFRIDKSKPRLLSLQIFGDDHDIFDEIDDEEPSRKQYERAIRRHARDLDLDEEAEWGGLIRIDPEHVELFSDITGEGGF